MTRSQSLAARIREVLLDGKWVANTNFKEQLIALHWEQAIQKIGDLNTIALLTFHVNYYLAGLLQVFNGGELEIRDKYSFDMPAIRSANDWESLLEAFLGNAEKFASKIEHLPDEALDQPFVEEKYGSNLRNIEAVIEHCYYHLGQVSLLRKLILADS